MKIVRLLSTGYFALCADTARVNRGECYFFSSSSGYALMPCLLLQMAANSRTLTPAKLLDSVDAFGFALHVENSTTALDDRKFLQTYSADRSIIVSERIPFSSARWQGIQTIAITTTNHVVEKLLPPLLSSFQQALEHLTTIITLNMGDWLLYPLLHQSLPLTFPERVYLEVDNTRLLDEQLCS